MGLEPTPPGPVRHGHSFSVINQVFLILFFHFLRPDLPHRFLGNKWEEQNPADQQLWSGLDQEEPDPPQIKEEHEDEEQLVLKQDAETSMVTSAYQHISNSEAEPDRDRFRRENPPEPEGPDMLGSWNGDSGSTRDPERKPKKGRSRTGSPDGFWSGQPVLKQEEEFMSPNSDLLVPVRIPAAEVRHPEGLRNDRAGTTERQIRGKNSRTCVAQSEAVPNAAPRPVSCDVCGKNFRCNSDMRVHYRVHTGEKPFSCGVCQRAFSYKVNLSVHMRTHTGEKPYSCQLCEKRFSDHSSLRKHTYVHTGERPFSCAVCGKRFSRNSHRWRHVRLHAAAMPSA